MNNMENALAATAVLHFLFVPNYSSSILLQLDTVLHSFKMIHSFFRRILYYISLGRSLAFFFGKVFILLLAHSFSWRAHVIYNLIFERLSKIQHKTIFQNGSIIMMSITLTYQNQKYTRKCNGTLLPRLLPFSLAGRTIYQKREHVFPKPHFEWLINL